MVCASPIPHVSFFCLDDEYWTIDDGKESLLTFLDCSAEYFVDTYRNSLVKLLSQPKKPLADGVQVVIVQGISCLCSFFRKEGRIFVTLDKLPMENLLQEADKQHVGLFYFSEDGKLVWANDAFYDLIGCPKKDFSDLYHQDLSAFDQTLSSLSSTSYVLDTKRSLFFFVHGYTGFCLDLSHREATELGLYRKALVSNGIRVWRFNLANKEIDGVLLEDFEVSQLSLMHQRLLDGEQACSDILFFNEGKRCVHVQYHVQDGYAYAVEKDISKYQPSQHLSFFDNHIDHMNLMDMQSIMKVDLTANKVIHLKKGAWNPIDSISSNTYGEVYEKIKHSLVFEEEIQVYERKLRLESLKKAYEEGVQDIFLEFRSCDEFGNIRWMELRLFLNLDLDNGHLYALGTSQFVTEKKKIELSLNEKANRDRESGFYDRHTISMMVEGSLKGEEDLSSSYAFILIDIKGLKKQPSLVEPVLVPHVARIIRLGLFDRCMIGRVDATRFVVFLEQVDRVSQIRSKLEKLANMIANAYLFVPITHALSCSIGYTTGFYRENASFQFLFEKASLSLDKAREMGRNQVYAFDWEKPSTENRVRPVSILDENAQGVLLGCMDATLSGDNLASTMPLVLSQVGMYYQSKRVCLLTQEKGEMLSMYASWEPVSSSSVYGLFDSNPFLSLFDKQDVKKITTTGNYSKYQCLSGTDFYIGNLQVWNMENAYLVVVNPRNDDISVLSHSIQLIGSELTKRRLLDRQEFLVYHDPVTGFKNFNGYNQYVSTLKEDALSSTGLLVAEINELKEINKYHGKDYGNELITLISTKLNQLFPNAELFRISGHEFIAIRHDLTYEAFNHKVSRLSHDLYKDRPGMITLGQAWSEHEQHVSVLYNQAMMELEAKRQNALNASSEGDHYQAFEELKSSIDRDEYLVYLQPKVSSTSFKVCGAEALVRHLHPQHGLISPSKFIPQLERDALIKYIDLFVFEQVCKILQRWKNDGKELFPISLNFSRLTLLDENLISLMQEIKERYEVDCRFLEIEITESFGALDRNLVQKVVHEISDAGYCVCIDDFGSEYSNLSTLTSLPLGVLKLDKSLIDTLGVSEKGQVFVDGFISICKKLGIKTVAEGVETESQLHMVTGMGCDMVQGYFYDKPLTIANFEKKYQFG